LYSYLGCDGQEAGWKEHKNVQGMEKFNGSINY
jgi:hypothetical protein